MEGTTQVVNRLRAEGFRVNAGYVAWLIRDRWLPTPEKGPGGAFIWTDADAQRLRSFLHRRGRGPKGGDA